MEKIFGIFGEHKKSDLKEMGKSFKIKDSRTDFFCEKKVGMGSLFFNNTSPILWNKKRDVCIVYSGRIFGTGEMEVGEYLLKTYEEKGIEFVKSLNGIFVVVILDLNKKELLICNDRFGMKPFYYYKDKERFIFGSEVKALIASGLIKKEVDWKGWKDIFQFGYIIGEKTLFKNVKRIPGGSVLKIKSGKVETKSYWDFGKIELNKKTKKEFIEEGKKILEETIKRQTKKVKEVDLLLSGGYDSRTIASCLKKFTDVEVKTFTSGLHPSGIQDMEYAKKISEKLGIENESFGERKNLYEKYFERLLFLMDFMAYEHLWAVSLIDQIEKKAINIDGIGGDVLMRGSSWLPYDRFELDLSNNIIEEVIRKKLTRNSDVSRFFEGSYSKKIQPSGENINKEIKKIKNKDYAFTEFIMKTRTRNSVCLIPENAMARKADNLFFFLDNRIVKFALSIPPKMKSKNFYNRLLNKLFPGVMKVPSTRDINFFENIKVKLKDSLIRKRLKKGKYNWPEGNIPAMKRTKEDIDYLVKRFEKVKCGKFVKKEKSIQEIKKYLGEGEDPSNFLIPLLTFCLWYEKYFLS